MAIELSKFVSFTLIQIKYTLMQITPRLLVILKSMLYNRKKDKDICDYTRTSLFCIRDFIPSYVHSGIVYIYQHPKQQLYCDHYIWISYVILFLLSFVNGRKMAQLSSPQCHPSVLKSMPIRIRRVCEALTTIMENSEGQEMFPFEKGKTKV